MPTLKALKQRKGGAALKDFLVYRDGRDWADLASDDVNAFIKETAGEGFSAKDFRTWNATVLAAVAVAGHDEREKTTKAARKRVVSRVVANVARYLGNTPTVCRSSYIDPRVVDRFLAGDRLAAVVDSSSPPTVPRCFRSVRRSRAQ